MAITLKLTLCFIIKPLTCKNTCKYFFVGFVEKLKPLTNKQNEKHTFVRCFSVPRKLLFAFWTLHNNLVSTFDFDIISRLKGNKIHNSLSL